MRTCRTELADLAARTDLVTHTSTHTDLWSVAGSRVAVVGAGQSALETAALLGECGAEPVLIAHTPWSGTFHPVGRRR